MLTTRYGKCLVLISFLLPASAAIASTSPWQGPYIGAYVGGAFGNTHASTNAGAVTSTSYFTTGTDVNAVNTAGSFQKNPSTGIIGIQAGHDWAWKQLIYGIAADYGALPLSSSDTVTQTYSSGSDQYSVYTAVNTNWLFTLRGRLGYETEMNFPRFHWPSLLYVTGGLALAKLEVNNNFSDNSALAGAGGISTSQNQIGWTAGVGIEAMIYDHVSVDLQYLYMNIPSVKTTSSITNTAGGFGIPEQSLTNSFVTTGKLHANLFQVGLNYRFND